MVDRTLASTLIEGSVSSLNYANKLNGFVTGIFITSIVSVVYPTLSKLSSERNKERFINAMTKSINVIVLLVTPISVGAIVLSNPIVKFLFERGEFDSNATSMTAAALTMYSIGMVFYGIRDILIRVFHSMQDTNTPMINGIISVVMNILLNVILVKYLGHMGLALATSLSAIICIVLLFKSLKSEIGYFGQKKIINTSIKAIISALLMGLVTYFTYHILNNTLGSGSIKEAIALFGAIGIGSVLYSILVIILKVEEVYIIIEMIKNKLNKVTNRFDKVV